MPALSQVRSRSAARASGYWALKLGGLAGVMAGLKPIPWREAEDVPMVAAWRSTPAHSVGPSSLKAMLLISLP